MWTKIKNTKLVQGFIKLKNDLKPMTFKEKCEHLWEYYKEWLLVVFLVCMGIGLVSTIVASRSKEVMVSGMMVNIQIKQEGVNYLTSDYRAYLGATSKDQVAELDSTNFGDPLDPEHGEDSYYASMILPARVTGAMLDYMILDKFALEYYIAQEVYMDLREVFTAEELAQLAAEDRVIYAMQADDIESWPIAIKITNLDFVKEYVTSPGEIYFTLSGSSPRRDMCRHVWQYLNNWKKPE
jgi:hypothetical protein